MMSSVIDLLKEKLVWYFLVSVSSIMGYFLNVWRPVKRVTPVDHLTMYATVASVFMFLMIPEILEKMEKFLRGG